MKFKLIASLLAILNILSIYSQMAKAVSISSYNPGPHREINNDVNSNWQKAKSNPDFAFTEINNPLTGSKVLKLKNLKTGEIKTLIRSSAIESIGKVRDVAPNGRTVIFETLTEADGEYINQSFLFNTNGQKFFLISDGLRRKKDKTLDLREINFTDKKVDLVYKTADQKHSLTRTIELIAKYSLVFEITNDKDRIKKFYGGSLPYGTKEINLEQKENKKIYSLSFDPKVSSVVKHQFIIENHKITKFFEFNKDDLSFDTKTEFIEHSHSTETFIYNKEGEIQYSGSSFGPPSTDLISLNLYLRKEVSEFYNASLGPRAQISILGKKVFIDMNDGSDMPIQSLLFAFSYSNFGDYGFYSFARQSRDMKSKEIFVFSNKNKSVTYSKTLNGSKERIVLNNIDQFNYNYAEISSDMHAADFIGSRF